MNDEVKQLFTLFVESSREELSTLERDLVAIETGDRGEERLDAVRRHLHTIKGGCGMFGLQTAARLAHALEDLVASAIESGAPAGELTDLFLEGADLLQAWIDARAAGGGDPAEAPAHVFLERVEAAQARIAAAPDGLAEAVGALTRVCAGIREELEGLHDFGPLEEALRRVDHALAQSTAASSRPSASPPQREETGSDETGEEKTEPEESDEFSDGASSTAAPSGKTVRVGTETVGALLRCSGELVSAAEICKHLQRRMESLHASPEMLRDFRSLAARIEENAFELQGTLLQLRRVPVRAMLTALPRLCRDLARELGKGVEVTLEGEEAFVDKSVLERLEACLVQILRNAVAHGIESPAARAAAGKPARGSIRVSARNDEDCLLIEASDDGAGLDLGRIKEKAVRLGALAPDRAANLSDAEAAMLIFASGLSTAPAAGLASGRGVGLDVVGHELRILGGQVTVETAPGTGTRFLLRVPLDRSLSVLSGIVLQTGATRFVIPVAAVVESVHPDAEALSTVQKRGETLLLRGELLPLHRSARLFGVKDAQEDALRSVALVVQHGTDRAALLFDRIHDIQQVVLKTIAGVALAPGLQGGAILADGGVGLVLDVEAILGRLRENA